MHHRQTIKKEKLEDNNLHGNIQRRRNNKNINYIHRTTYIQKKYKKNIHNNNKLRNLYTGINTHPTQTHMIAEPFDSSVRMK